MGLRIPSWATCVVYFLAATAAHAATIAVPAGGDLQAALNAAQPGDVITLEPNATYTGNFILPNKPLPDNGDAPEYITIRSAAPDSVFPADGVRITPAYASASPEDQVAGCPVGAADSDRSAPLQADVPGVPGQCGRRQRHHHHRRRRFDADRAHTSAVRLHPGSTVCPWRPRTGTEARHRAPQRRHHGHQLVGVRLQGHRSGLAGHRRLQRARPLCHREQLPRSRGARISARRRRSADSESGHDGRHRSATTISANRSRGATRSSRRRRTSPRPRRRAQVSCRRARTTTKWSHASSVTRNHIAASVATAEVAATLDADGAVTISWTPVATAQEYPGVRPHVEQPGDVLDDAEPVLHGYRRSRRGAASRGAAPSGR